MRGIICYFSTTGNTKLACEHIKDNLEKLQLDLYDVTSGDEIDIMSYDIIGFATYSHFGLPSKKIVDFINELGDVDQKPSFAFNTFGMMNGNTTATLASVMKSSGFKVLDTHALHTPENYPPLLKKGTTEENAPSIDETVDFNNFIEHLDRISVKLTNRETLAEQLPKESKVVKMLGGFISTFKMDQMGTKQLNLDTCNGCSICSKKCFYDAITMKEGHPKFDETKCESCYACFNNCPQKSIYTKKVSKESVYKTPPIFIDKMSN